MGIIFEQPGTYPQKMAVRRSCYRPDRCHSRVGATGLAATQSPVAIGQMRLVHKKTAALLLLLSIYKAFRRTTELQGRAGSAGRWERRPREGARESNATRSGRPAKEKRGIAIFFIAFRPDGASARSGKRAASALCTPISARPSECRSTEQPARKLRRRISRISRISRIARSAGAHRRPKTRRGGLACAEPRSIRPKPPRQTGMADKAGDSSGTTRRLSTEKARACGLSPLEVRQQGRSAHTVIGPASRRGDWIKPGYPQKWPVLTTTTMDL